MDATRLAEKTKEALAEYREDELSRAIERKELAQEDRCHLQILQKLGKLKELQRTVRESMLKEVISPASSEFCDPSHELSCTLVSRQYYLRDRTLSIYDRKEAKLREKYERNMRTWQDQRIKGKHKEFLQELAVHYKAFMDFHKKKQQAVKKCALQAKGYFDIARRKEQSEKDRNEGERLRMLRANEMDKYVDMINITKNSRLLEILDQTHKYLEQLGAKVMKQKHENMLISHKSLPPDETEHESPAGMPMVREAAEGARDVEEPQHQADDSISDNERVKRGLKNSTKVYYSLTHAITEEVVEDPKSLTGGKLKSYQLQGLQWLVSLHNNCLNGILADEMGLGKTIQTIALFCYLMEKKNNDGPFLVVVPLSTISNWMLEFDKWAPHVKKLVYKGDPATRRTLGLQMRHEKFNVVLTTYDYIMKDRATLNRIAWQYIIVDEGHRMKNSKCKFAMMLGQNYQSAHRILLTGTPLQNNLSELWALLNFLLPRIFSSCEEFEKWFNRPFAKLGMEKNVPLNEEERLLIINRLHQVLRPFLLRRMKKEVEQELPNKIEYVIKVELSGWQKIFYNQLKEHGMLARDPSTGKIGSRSLMNTMMQLRKICNHPYLFLQNYDTEFLISNICRCSGKFELLDRMLPKLISMGHKILIFSQMTQLMDIMQLYFNCKKITHLRLDGTTKVDDRGHCTALFNAENSEYRIFLLSTRAGGQGLNLQAADTVILFDSDFNPQMDLQAQDRAHRIGQKHEVRVYRLVTSTRVEEDILSRAAVKKNIDNVVIQAGLFNQKASDSERRKKLEDLIRQDEKAADEDDTVPDDEQINEFLARTEAEFAKYQQMDQERYVAEHKDEQLKRIAAKLKLDAIPPSLNYRLMHECEVPEWVKSKPQEEKEPVEIGKRVRKKVNYADDITERQWERCITEGRDLNEEAKRLRSLREQRKRKKATPDSDENEEEKKRPEEKVEDGMLDDAGIYCAGIIGVESGLEEEDDEDNMSVDKMMIEMNVTNKEEGAGKGAAEQKQEIVPAKEEKKEQPK